MNELIFLFIFILLICGLLAMDLGIHNKKKIIALVLTKRFYGQEYGLDLR